MQIYETLADLTASTQAKSGRFIFCRENYGFYIVQDAGYVAGVNDITVANGRVVKYEFLVSVENIQDGLALPSQSGNEDRILTTDGLTPKWVDTPPKLQENTGAGLIGTTSGNSIQDELTALSDGQTGGVIVFTTYALLTAYTPATTAEERSSYKVTNDPTSSNNGYYHWVTGTTYAKDAELVADTVDVLNTSEGVSGEAVDRFVVGRTDLAFTDVPDYTIVEDFYLRDDGTSTAFTGGGYTNKIYVYGNGSRTLYYSGRYGNQCVGIIFYDVDDNIISFTSQASVAEYTEQVAIPASAYYMQISTTQRSTLEFKYLEENIPSVLAKSQRYREEVKGTEFDLSGVARTNGVYLDATNGLVAFTNSRVYEAIPVVAGSQIRYDAKFGGSAVAMLFLDEIGDVISAVTEGSNDWYQGVATVPDNAVQVRFSSTDVSDVDPVFGYVKPERLQGLDWNSVGDSITAGSSIRTGEGWGIQEAERAVYCGLIARRNNMAVTNNGMGGTRVAAFNPYGRTVSYLNGSNVVLGYDEIHYLPLNGSANGKTFNAPTGCTKIRLTIAYTDPDDSNNSIADLSGTLSVKQGDDLTAGAELYNSANNVSGSYVKYDGSLQADATGIYVEIPVTAGLQYSFSDIYEFAVVGAYRYQSFVERMSTIMDKEYDLLTIMGGTNDRNDYVIGDDDSVSPYEFKGALNLMIKEILDTYPLTHVGLITVLRFNTETYIDEFAQAMLDIGSKWSVPVLDMRKSSGINVIDVDDFAGTNYDVIHPNLDGNVKMSYPIENFLRSL